jgi:nitrogen regulatory protein PII
VKYVATAGRKATPKSIVDAITKAARSGKIGDGKIFVSDIKEAVRIRDSQRGDEAL